MNKLLVRSTILIILLALLILIVFKVRSPFGKNNSSFAVDPGSEITGIEFSQEGRKLNLENNGESWLINGKSEARKTSINFILRILKEIKIKSPVSDELFNTEITDKNIIPVRVKVYQKGRILKSFFVYKTRSNIYGNIMKIREGSKPFIVYVPDYEGDIGSGFILNELFWQPYIVFNLLPSEIASVQFENMTDTSESFSIVNRNQHYSISSTDHDISGYDSSKVTRYISYFARVPFESWAFETGEKEQNSIESHQPLYRIIVVTIAGRKIVLSLWAKSDEKDPAIIDTDRLFGKTDERDDLFIMRYFDIDPLIKKRSYFYSE